MDEKTRIVDLLIQKTEAGEIEWRVRSDDSPSWKANIAGCYLEVHPISIILVRGSTSTSIDDEVLIKRLEEVLKEKYPPASLTEKQRFQVFIDCLENDKNSN